MDRQTRLLPLIASFKIAKALLLFAVAFGLHRLWHGDTQALLLNWMRDIKIDPDNVIPQKIISRITGTSPARLHQLGVGIFFYGSLFGIEGVGLLLKQRWAEYMTVISTTMFLPLEIFELIFRPERKVFKAIILLLNVAILIYLLVNLLKARRPVQVKAE